MIGRSAMRQFDIIDSEPPIEDKRRPARSEQRELDKFYTLEAVAGQCMDFVKQTIGSPTGLWIEPSAGAGIFLGMLPHPRIGMDVEPDSANAEIVRQDFFSFAPAHKGPITTIGNPPFGRNASLALKFLNHAACYSRKGDHICFVLPRTFEKQTMQAKVNRHLQLIDEMPMDAASFTHDGEPYEVPCCFQIWRRLGDTERRGHNPRFLTHAHFDIVSEEEAPHFAFQRVGANAGHVSDDGLSKSWKSHYFIRARIDVQTLKKRLTQIDWRNVRSQTAGNPSIGKRDLVEKYVAYMAEHGIEPEQPTERTRVLENYTFDLDPAP